MLGLPLLFVTCALASVITLVVCMSHNVNWRIRLAFVAFCLPLTLWQTTIFIADNIQGHLFFWNNLVFLWSSLAVLGCFFFVISLRSASKEYHKNQTRNVLTLILVAALTGFQLIAISANKILDGIDFNTNTGVYEFDRGSLYPVYTICLVSVLGIAIGRLVASYAASKKYPQERHAFKIILITIGVAALYGVTTNIAIPIITGSQKLIDLGMLTVDILAFGLALSIIRYRFLDIRLYVFRAAGYISALALTALVYVCVMSVSVSNLLEIPLTVKAMVILSIASLVLAISFHPLHEYFNRLTNKLFFRDYYDPQDVLDQLGRLLVGTVDLLEIQEKSREILDVALNPSSVVFLLSKDSGANKDLVQEIVASELDVITDRDAHDRGNLRLMKCLREFDISVAVRLRTAHEDLGFLLVGPRKAGTEYSMADIHFLGVVADQLALGLQGALRFQEIQKFNETLQEKIEEATRQLRHSNEKLRKLDQTKDDFISMSSHQLRTPLTAMKGYVSMVLEGDGGDLTHRQRKMLTQAFVSTQRMSYLISDLLNVSRLKSGKFMIEPVLTNLSRVVKEEVEQLAETVRVRKLTMTYHRPEHFPTLYADEMKLRQVMMNFMDNAIYYTPEDGHIDIYLVEKTHTIEFTVVDSGIGVPRDEQHHLFSKFYRAHNAKHVRPDGTGLGIFMAKKVIIAQGGAIIFKSAEGRGSTFGFTIPKSKLQPPPKGASIGANVF
jgi:signal transduction histidine kinase